MAVIITCPGCGLRGQIPEALNTPSLRCPRCNAAVPNPGAGGSAPPANNASPGSLLDEFFTRAFAAAPTTSTKPIPPVAANLPPMPAPQAPPVAAPPVPPEPRPAADNGAKFPSPQAEEQWIREERQRLEAYMSKHFAMLQKQREELANWRTQVEAALVTREQELNRQQKALAAQTEALQQRTAELGDKEAALTKQVEEIQSAGEQILQEIAVQKETLEKIRNEVEQARQEMNQARQEQGALQAGFVTEKQAMEAERTAWVQQGAKRKELQDSLTRAEAALRRRVSESLNLEAQIYHELERQEQRLAIERRQIEQTRQDLIAVSDEKTVLRRKIGVLSQELEKLRRPVPPAR